MQPWVTLSLGVVLVACGPTVATTEASDSASGGQSGTSGSTQGSSETEAASNTGGGETSQEESSSGGPPALCGNAVVEGDEACDDGNVENADGCSAACEVSGSIRWIQPLPAGFSIGLSAREGRVVAGLQQYTGLLEPATVLIGVESDGTLIGEYTDEGGFSDRDIAREPIALLPGGRVALGYAVLGPSSGPVQRDFGILDFDLGLVGEYLDTELTGGRSYGTTYHPSGTVLLRSDDRNGEPMLVLQQFDDTATLLESFPLELPAAEHRPIARGAVPEQSFPMALVFTTTPAGAIDLHASLLAPDWESTRIADAGVGGTVASFSDALGLRLWTGTELIAFDTMDHPQEAQALSFDGELLWADADGFVVAKDAAVVLYDAAGVERASALLSVPDGPPMRAQFVRPDPAGGGLFVLADAETTSSDPGDWEPASLLYVVR